MRLVVIGINHKIAPLEVREKFSFTRKRLREGLENFKDSSMVSGAVILSTCNRMEVYFDIKDDCLDPEEAISFVFGMFRAKKEDIERYFYIFEDMEAVRHLLRVASGLDSQVLGEGQILTQVNSAWIIAKEMGSSSDELDKIFEKAQKAASGIRLETRISKGNISIGSIAIRLLKDRLKDLRGRSALIIGAGKTGTLITKCLKEENMKGIFVASRTYARALKLASICGGRALGFDNLKEELKSVDIVISSTSSPHLILKKDLLMKVMETRKQPLFIMDLAVPRDIDPEARDIKDVFLYDLDDLKCVAGTDYKDMEKEAMFAERLVEKEVSRFLADEEEALSKQEA